MSITSRSTYRFRLALLIAGSLVFVACSQSATPPASESSVVDLSSGAQAEPEPLVRTERWGWVDPGADPFVSSASSGVVRCDARDVREESGGLEVSTIDCNSATLVQPLERDLAVGSELSVLVWWATLASDAPARAELELRIGETTLWTLGVDIPGEADVADPIIVIDREFLSGTPVYFHLHNHGYNTWNINRIDWRAPQ